MVFMLCSVFSDVQTHVSCRGYVGILKSAQVTAKQGGTADYIDCYSSLTEMEGSVGGFFIS